MGLNRRQWFKATAMGAVAAGLHRFRSRSIAGQEEAATGRALTIGLNWVDPQHYAGWSGPLEACEQDADDMGAIARQQGFGCTTLKTEAATRRRVIEEIASAAAASKGGDIFMLSYSGHGGQTPDLDGDEWDNQDETWCLYDGQLLDDELAQLWAQFAEDVRIVMFSDSCHSGTMAKFAAYRELTSIDRTSAWSRPGQRAAFDALVERPAIAPEKPAPSPVRAMPEDVARAVYRANREYYQAIAEKTASEKDSADKIRATVLLISGCQDNQLSADGVFNGLFTGMLKQTWGGGLFQGNYRDFHSMIVSRMPPYQSPNYYIIGKPNTAFENQRPFTI